MAEVEKFMKVLVEHLIHTRFSLISTNFNRDFNVFKCYKLHRARDI